MICRVRTCGCLMKMLPLPPHRRIELRRWALLCRSLGGALVWALIEVLALLRQRYHQKRWSRSI